MPEKARRTPARQPPDQHPARAQPMPGLTHLRQLFGRGRKLVLFAASPARWAHPPVTLPRRRIQYDYSMASPGRAVITLSATDVLKARKLSENMGGIPLPEVVRRGLRLLRLQSELPEGAFLAVVHQDRSIDRVFMWD